MAPTRVDHPSKLTIEALWCHCFNHDWDFLTERRANFNIKGRPQVRQTHRCDRGCGCEKSCYIDLHSGERWGWSRTTPDGYGLDGGWTRADCFAELVQRLERDDAAKPVPSQYRNVRKLRRREGATA